MAMITILSYYYKQSEKSDKEFCNLQVVGGEVLKYKRTTVVVLFLILILLTSCNIVENISQTEDASLDESFDSSEFEPEYGGHIILPITKINSLNPLTVNNESYFYFSKLILKACLILIKTLML